MTSGTGNSRRALRGFTLIEVLVATVILFGGLAAVLGAYSSAVTALDRAGDELAAAQLLGQKAAEVEWAIGADPQGIGPRAGVGVVGSVPYEWTVERGRAVAGAGSDEVEVVIGVRRQGRVERRSLITRWTLFPADAKSGEVGR